MIKAKRILAMVLATVMAMSLLVCPAFAAGKLEITYWNADSTKITLDFTEEVEITNLKNAITLTLGDEDVAFTVKKKTPTTTATLADEFARPLTETTGVRYREPLVADTDVTYEIYPEGGLEFDKIYFLTVAGGLIGTDGGILTGGNWEKGIKVVKLWKETFDSYADIASTPWMKSAGTMALIDDGNGDKSLSLTMAGGGDGMMAPVAFTSGNRPMTTADANLTKLIFADTNTEVGTYFKDSSDARKQNEYNMELELTVDLPEDNSTHAFVMNMTNAGHRQPNYGGTSVMAGLGYMTDLPVPAGELSSTEESRALSTTQYRLISATSDVVAYTYNAIFGYQVNGHPYKTDSSAVGTSIYHDQYPTGAGYSSSAEDSLLVDGATHKLSMSVKDSNVKFGISSSTKDGYTSYNFKNGRGADLQLGYPVFSVKGDYSKGSTTYVIDNIIATKAIGYTRSFFTMTPADESVEAPISDTITLTFPDYVDADTISADTIKVYANDVLLTGYTASVNEDDASVVDIKLADVFDYRTTYKVIPDGVYLEEDDTIYYFGEASFVSLIADTEFSTLEADINYEADPDDPEKQIWSAGTYTVNAVFENNKIENGAKGVITICLYDENMKMVDVAVKAIDVALGDNDTISDTWTITEAGAYTAKCYVWDGFVNLNQILEGTIE